MRTLVVAFGLVVALTACQGDGTEPVAAALDDACATAAALAAASPWPPPTGFGIEGAVRATGQPELIAALEEALSSQTDHERVAGANYVGVAPSEAQALVAICDRLLGT